MNQARRDSRDRKIAQLQAKVQDLEARLAESEKLHAAGQLSLLELGLRLSQENEALRRELAALKSPPPQ